MTDPLERSAHEHGMTRVFVAEADPDAPETPMTNDEAARLLGTDVDVAKIEVVPAGSLAGMGLSGYLVEGYGVAADDVAQDRQRLDGLGGQIVLVPSSATGGAARFAPEEPLRFVGLYGEPPTAAHEVMTPAASEERPAEPVEVDVPDTDASGRPERKVPVAAIVIAGLILAALLFIIF